MVLPVTGRSSAGDARRGITTGEPPPGSVAVNQFIRQVSALPYVLVIRSTLFNIGSIAMACSNRNIPPDRAVPRPPEACSPLRRRLAAPPQRRCSPDAAAVQTLAQNYVAIENTQIQNVSRGIPPATGRPTRSSTRILCLCPSRPWTRTSSSTRQGRSPNRPSSKDSSRRRSRSPPRGGAQVDGQDVPQAAEVPPEPDDRLFPRSALPMIAADVAAQEQTEDVTTPMVQPEEDEGAEPAENVVPGRLSTVGRRHRGP